MQRWKSWSLILLVVVAGWIAGRWIGGSAADSGADAPRDRREPLPRRIFDDPHPGTPKIGKRDETGASRSDPDAPPDALPGQRTVTFDSAEAMRRFLASLDGSGISVLGRIDRLNTLLLDVPDADALAALLDGSEELGYIFPAVIPGDGSVQSGAVGFGTGFLEWLGIDGDRTGWGEGVTVAVLDTGVGGDSIFAKRVRAEYLIDPPDDPASLNDHGTAVAALIAGGIGLAPDASILSYRIAGDDGTSNTFLIAEAIIAATDAGADIINISLGSSTRSALLENAIRHATEAGAVVVASAGNNGTDRVAYPAAFEQVIGVGSVDARGDHLDFSNSGKIAVTAPGLALTSAGIDGGPLGFSGTSASAPVVAGAIAAVMSREGVTASRAWSLIASNANEAGAPGPDPSYGAGILDVGRTLNRSTPGITDIALASNHLTTNAAGHPMLQVTVENRGTTAVVNAPVNVTTPLGTSQLNITTLAPGGIHTFDLPLGTLTEPARVDASVALSDGTADRNPANNRRVDVVAPPVSP